MRGSAFLVVLILLLAGLVSCRPEVYEVAVPDLSAVKGSTSSLPRGIITGFVTLHDEFGQRKADNSGMVVSVEGELTAFPAATRSEGRFTINNVYAGPYNLIYTKNGYGTYRKIRISHAGSSTPTIVEPVDLWETPQTVVKELAVQVSGQTLTLSGVATPVQEASADTARQRRVRLFLGRDEQVSHQNYVSTLKQIRVEPGGRGAFSLKLSADELTGFGTGARIYAVAYGITAIENAWVDPVSKRNLYAGVNPTPSNVVSFVLP